MKVICYGARGSIPAPSRAGFSTIKYGGNTTCYRVIAGPFDLILDHGSGATVLSDHLLREKPRERIVLSSHYHWDHVQGLPFCVPYFIAANTFHIHGVEPTGHETRESLGNTVEQLLAQQQASPHFPVAHNSLPSKRVYHSHPRLFSEKFTYYIDGNDKMQFCPKEMINSVRETLPADIANDPRRYITITTIPVNHPEGCLGFRIDWMQYSFVFCTDHEPARFPWAQITKIGKGADLILLDGQYTEAQIAGMTQGFGHGTPESCVEQAVACGVKGLLIHHHDPKHDDDTLDKMFSQLKVPDGMFVTMAREGEIYDLDIFH